MSFRRNIKSGVINAAGDVSANESTTSLHSSALAAGSSMIGLVAPGKQHLCSCGHRELDTILGGGFQFGSVSAILGNFSARSYIIAYIINPLSEIRYIFFNFQRMI